MSGLLSKTITNRYNSTPSNTNRTLSKLTSTINFDSNVTVPTVKITYAYSQSGYSAGQGSIVNSTLEFFDKNNKLLHTITPTRIYDITSRSTSKYVPYDVTANVKKVRKVILTSEGYNIGGYALHTAVVNYKLDYASDKIEEGIFEIIKKHKPLERVLTYELKQ